MNASLPCGATASAACAGGTAGRGQYEVCALLGAKKVGAGHQILVHYKGYRTCAQDVAWHAASEVRQQKEPNIQVGLKELIAGLDAGVRADSITPAVVDGKASSDPLHTASEPDSDDEEYQPSVAASEGTNTAPPLVATAAESVPSTQEIINLLETDAAEESTPSAFALVPIIPKSNTCAEPAQAPTLRAATQVRISGEGNRCWYRAVARQLAVTEEQITAILRHTVSSIEDAVTLCSYGLMDSPEDDSPAAVERARQAYLSHPNFASRSHGGSAEMYLLSHAMDAVLSRR